MINLNKPSIKLFLALFLLLFGTEIIAQTRSETPVLISKDATIGLISLTIPTDIKNQAQKAGSKMMEPVILSQYVEHLNGTVTVAFNSKRAITDVWVSKDMPVSKEILLQNNRMLSNGDDCETFADWEYYICRFKEVVTDISS